MKPNFHHRKSIRLKGYDYSKAGLYYITICTQDRSCLFGDVLDGEMFLNQAGKMIEKWYFKLESKYSDIKCHEMYELINARMHIFFPSALMRLFSKSVSFCLIVYHFLKIQTLTKSQLTVLTTQPQVTRSHVSYSRSGSVLRSTARLLGGRANPLHPCIRCY